jgi:hypothetical protein
MEQTNKIPTIENWEHFEKIIADTETIYQKFKEGSRGGWASPPLYRGQTNARDWKLKTTLERFLGKNISVKEYLQLISRIKPIVENNTSNSWQLPSIENFLEMLDKYHEMPRPFEEFMAYLRHHEFPSPLLDWTECPYVAAFFAFKEDRDKNINSAIYIYFSDIGNGKNVYSDMPTIVRTEKGNKGVERHERQKSKYTYCVIRGSSCANYTYASHEEAFSLQENGIGDWQDKLIGKGKQDIRKKYILPYEQRENFLNKLSQRNINAYFLYGNEEGLMHKLAIEELLLKKLTIKAIK